MNTPKSKYHAQVFVLAVILASFLFVFNLTPQVFAAPTSKPTYNKAITTTVKKPNIFEQFFSFVFSPFKFLFASKPPAAVKKQIAKKGDVKAVATSTPKPTPTLKPTPTPSPSATTTSLVITSLPKGVTYIDLIGKTIIDSSGNLYPSGAALAQTNKPSLGTTTNKYYGLYLNNFSIDKDGNIDTVLPGGVLKTSSTGVISSGAISIDSSDITGTLQTGSGGTGITSYTVGDILYSGTTNSLTKLNVGSANQVLTVSGGVPVWASSVSLSGTTSLADGSATTPALNFTSDTDSGLWRIGANNIALTTGGSPHSGIVINGSGNIGIGTSAPVSAFQIGSPLGLSSNILSFSTSTGRLGVGTTTPGAGLSLTQNLGVGVSFANAVVPGSGLAVSGNVGIGATTANSTLSVAGSAHIGALYQGTAAPANGLFVDGNVGIGATTSSNKLDVWGNVGIGQSLNITDLTYALGGIRVNGYSSLTGNVGVGTSLTVANVSALDGGLKVTGFSDLTGNVGVGTSLTVTSAGVFSSGITVAGTSALAGITGTTLITTGNVGIGASSSANRLDVWGNERVSGTLTVDQATTLQSTLGVTGVTTLSANNAALSFTGSTPSITSGTSVFGIFGGGNVGIGTTSNLYGGFTIRGAGSGENIAVQTYGSNLAQGLTILDNGNVGVGTTNPVYDLEISGTLNITGAVSCGSGCAAGPWTRSGTFTSLANSADTVGIGTSAGSAKLSINGNSVIGWGTATLVGPTNGLAVSGNIGIGTTTANSALGVVGGVAIGNGAEVFGNKAAPSNGLAVEGNVGIGTSTANSNLSIAGNAHIGALYQATAGPANGLFVDGNVGIGATTSSNKLDVWGNVGIGQSLSITDITNALGGLKVTGYSNLTGSVGVGNSLTVGSAASLGTLSVTGISTLTDNVGIGNSLTVGSAAALTTLNVSGISNLVGNVGIGTSLSVTNTGAFGAGLKVTGFSDLTGNVGVGNSLTVTNVAALAAGLKVSGYSDLTGSVGIGNSLTVGSAAALTTLNVSGISNLVGNVGIGTSLTVANVSALNGGLKVTGLSDLTGNVGVGSSLTVTGTGAFGAGLKVTGYTDLTGNVGVGTSLTVANVAALNGGLKVTGYSDLLNNVGIGNSLTVGSAAALTTLSVSGISTLTGSVGIGSSLNVTSGALFSAGIKVAGASDLAAITGTSLNITTGNIGIGTSAAGASLSINGNGAIGWGTGSIVAPANGLAISGNIGIGTSTANSALGVVGGVSIGNGAQVFGNKAAPTNGLAVEGNVGIGATTAGSALFVNGGVAIGSNMNVAAPSNGLIVQGNVGIGTSAPAYAFVVGSPAQSGQFVVNSDGNVGIGVSGPSATFKLDVGGKVRATGFNGSCTVDQTYIGSCNQDIAEVYDSSENVAPGDVLAIDTSGSKLVKKSSGGYDANLFGVVSTSPGLILGVNGQDVYMGGDTSTYGSTADPKKPAVALTGKVPVKVSGENGAINIGDYLTSSATPGVAMKATKAGPVLGQAIEAYSGEGIGSIMVAVRLAYYNGSGLIDAADVAGEAAAEQSAITTSQLVLNRLMSQKDAVAAGTYVSEIVTDRIGAGLEIITPQLTADTVILGVFKPLAGKDLTLNLSQDQTFNITNEAGENAVSFDNQGNAFFKGQIVASAIKADTIEGLTVLANEVFAGKVSALLDQITKVQAASGSAVLAAVTSSELVRYNANGGLTVAGASEFKGQSIFSAVAEFIANVIFKGDVSFLGRIFLPRDSVGTAVIAAGSDTVTVTFSRGYGGAPTVNVTPTMQAGNDGAGNSILTGDVRFVVQNVSGSGFTIKLNKAAPADLVFSWTALANGGGNFTSTAPASTPPAPASSPEPTVAPSATPAPSVTPSASPEASALPSASPETSPIPSPSPEPSASATPAPSTEPTPSPSPTP